MSRFSVLGDVPVRGLPGLEELCRTDLPPSPSLRPLPTLPFRLVFPLRISRWPSGELLTKVGGKAVAAISSAEDGDKIVRIALERFGSVHILVANAGILRDKSFQAMTEKEWDQVLAVHLR